jgi:hypothetical protein
MPRQRRLVVPPAPLCSLRSHRLLRLIAEPARKRSFQSERPHSHKKFRARRGLVLRLRNRRRHGRSSVSAARAPSAQPADARSCRQGAARLAEAPPLSGDLGVARRGPPPPTAFGVPRRPRRGRDLDDVKLHAVRFAAVPTDLHGVSAGPEQLKHRPIVVEHVPVEATQASPISFAYQVV